MWQQVKRCDARAAAMADRHYSRQTHGHREFMPPGRTLVLLGPAWLWDVCLNLDPTGKRRWRVTIFRNEAPHLARSSDLIREATRLTYEYYGPQDVPLETEVDPRRTRHKRDPGRCFRKAGWTVHRQHRGLVVLRAPALEVTSTGPQG